MMKMLSRLNASAAVASSLFVLMSAQVMAQVAKTVDTKMVCVTNGEIKNQPDNRLLIESPSSRAIVKASSDRFGALEFEYLGPTAVSSELASGKVRLQIGIKLLDHNSCNAVYVMWRTGDEQGLEVSTKLNRNKTTLAECGVKGYKAIAPITAHDVPVLKPGDKHRLEASVDKQILTVKVDGKNAWQGDIGPAAAQLSGYSGIRTDNVRVRVRWLAAPKPSGPEKSVGSKPWIPSCKPIISASASRN